MLAESDRALAVVRDLFGDDPKVGWYYTSQLSLYNHCDFFLHLQRYTCQPNVTVAPHIITDKGKLERYIHIA